MAFTALALPDVDLLAALLVPGGGVPREPIDAREVALASLLLEPSQGEVLVCPRPAPLAIGGRVCAARPDRIGTRTGTVFEFRTPPPRGVRSFDALDGPDARTYARLQLAMMATGSREARVVVARAGRAGRPVVTQVVPRVDAWCAWAGDALRAVGEAGAS